MKRKDDSAAVHKVLRAIAIPAACIHGLLLRLGGGPQLQTTPDEAAQLRASLQINPEDLAARERLIHYYFDEATAPLIFKRAPLHDAEFTEQMLWIIRHHPDSRALALMAPAIRAGFQSNPDNPTLCPLGGYPPIGRRHPGWYTGRRLRPRCWSSQDW